MQKIFTNKVIGEEKKEILSNNVGIQNKAVTQPTLNTENEKN